MDPDAADLSTDEIVVEIGRGAIEAYRQIVVRYQREVIKIVNAMLLDVSARDDVVQQVFVRAFQKLDQYEIGRGFGKWLKAIARNLVREELRKRCRYRGRIEAYARSVLDQLDEGDSGGGTVWREEERKRSLALNECLKTLEDSSAQAVRLHYLEGKKTEEIAGLLGRSAGAVRTLLCRARANLRSCMESKGVLT